MIKRKRRTLHAIGTVIIERMPPYALEPADVEAGHVWEVLRVENGYHHIHGSALSREDAEILAETERAFA